MDNKVFKFEEAPCSCCEAHFLKSALDEEGRCKICAERGLKPGLVEEQEYIKSPEQQREELKILVKELLKEIQEEKEAEKKQKAFAPKPCKKCKKEFVPRSPAHVICDTCQEEARASKQ